VLTGSPAWLVQDGGKGRDAGQQRIEAWAGPWLLDERWWSTDRPSSGARVQLATEAGMALLVRSTAGGWWVEGVYD
jgi:protein ImuB